MNPWEYLGSSQFCYLPIIFGNDILLDTILSFF